MCAACASDSRLLRHKVGFLLPPNASFGSARYDWMLRRLHGRVLPASAQFNAVDWTESGGNKFVLVPLHEQNKDDEMLISRFGISFCTHSRFLFSLTFVDF
jgi:hypothetical protein